MFAKSWSWFAINSSQARTINFAAPAGHSLRPKTDKWPLSNRLGRSSRVIARIQRHLDRLQKSSQAHEENFCKLRNTIVVPWNYQRAGIGGRPSCFRILLQMSKAQSAVVRKPFSLANFSTTGAHDDLVASYFWQNSERLCVPVNAIRVFAVDSSNSLSLRP